MSIIIEEVQKNVFKYLLNLNNKEYLNLKEEEKNFISNILKNMTNEKSKEIVIEFLEEDITNYGNISNNYQHYEMGESLKIYVNKFNIGLSDLSYDFDVENYDRINLIKNVFKKDINLIDSYFKDENSIELIDELLNEDEETLSFALLHISNKTLKNIIPGIIIEFVSEIEDFKKNKILAKYYEAEPNEDYIFINIMKYELESLYLLSWYQSNYEKKLKSFYDCINLENPKHQKLFNTFSKQAIVTIHNMCLNNKDNENYNLFYNYFLNFSSKLTIENKEFLKKKIKEEVKKETNNNVLEKLNPLFEKILINLEINQKEVNNVVKSIQKI